MSDATGVFLYSRVMTFAECPKMHVPADELWLCTRGAAGPAADRAGLHLEVHRRHPAGPLPARKFAPLPNKLAEDFAIRAIEAQPLDYAQAVWADTWRVFGWKRQVFPERADLRRVRVPGPGNTDPDLGRRQPRPVQVLRGRVRAGQPEHPGGQPVRRDHPRLPGVRLAARDGLRAHPAGRAGRHRGGLAAAGRRGAAALGDIAGPDRHPGRDRRVRLPVRAAGRAVRLPGGGGGVQPRYRGQRLAAAATGGSRRRRRTTSTCSCPRGCRSRAGTTRASAGTAPTRPRTCRATRRPRWSTRTR